MSTLNPQSATTAAQSLTVGSRKVQHVRTRFGDIAYTDEGTGPVAVFVHGLFLNAYLWRHVIEGLKTVRRCIAIDLMGHGATSTARDQDLSFESQTEMLAEFTSALGIASFDLIGNDSGGGIAQILATRYEDRLRTLILTNCDTHDNCPPKALVPLMNAVAQGQLGALGQAMLSDLNVARQALGVGFQYPERLTSETVRVYLEPIFGTFERTMLFERLFRQCFLTEQCHQTFVLNRLGSVQRSTLIVWGTADVFFDVKWAYWLRDTIPGARNVVLLEGGHLFFPEERHEEFVGAVRSFWSEPDVKATREA